ncbi:MAG TPA: hypothetical protein PLG72_06245 [Clostridiales bacterium]|nr:hypothetical protein [Clostridiales bacterium]
MLPTFMQFAGNDVLVAHNAYNFDIKFLLAAACDIGIEIKNPIVDTLPLCRKLYPIQLQILSKCSNRYKDFEI